MIKAQPGFQEKALSTKADIAIIGGSAGGGKSFLLEVEPLRHRFNPGFGATFFRRTTTQIRAQGGLWDTSKKIYYEVPGAAAKESVLEWVFPSGARVKFAHLEHEDDVHNYQGSQIPFIAFDELTHFTEYQFWYMVSRNRTDCGVKPYIRASCNPDPNSWVAALIEWWINPETGYPIPERSGVLRYFIRDGGVMVWGDTKEEVIEKAKHVFDRPELKDSPVNVLDMVKSFTFISGTIFENKIFLKSDPGYLGNLLSLQEEEQNRLLKGNWKISLDGLMLGKWERIEAIFDNYPNKAASPRKYITVDAARFGKDFATVCYWEEWECKYLVVMKQSDGLDITKQIETLRMRFSVWRENVIVDADGVGDGTVKLGNYTAFHGGGAVLPEIKPDQNGRPQLFIPNYKNLKTQCAYYLFEKIVNTGQIRYTLTSENVLIFDGSYKDGKLGMTIKANGAVKNVRDLIKEDLRSYKRAETPNQGVDKKQIQSKELQKEALKRSPDFGDNALLRAYCDLMPKRKEMSRTN